LLVKKNPSSNRTCAHWVARIGSWPYSAEGHHAVRTTAHGRPRADWRLSRSPGSNTWVHDRQTTCAANHRQSTRPSALKRLNCEFVEWSIKVRAAPCELDNRSHRGLKRDLLRWAKVVSGTQSTVKTQYGLCDPDADAPLQTQALSRVRASQVELAGWQKVALSPVWAGAGDMVRVAARIPGPSPRTSGLTTTKHPRLITGPSSTDQYSCRTHDRPAVAVALIGRLRWRRKRLTPHR